MKSNVRSSVHCWSRAGGQRKRDGIRKQDTSVIKELLKEGGGRGGALLKTCWGTEDVL